MRHKVKRIHFVGIGGSGMSGIAEVLANLGYTVSGSDISEGPVVRRLRQMGIRIQVGHAAANVEKGYAGTSTLPTPRLPKLTGSWWKRSDSTWFGMPAESGTGVGKLARRLGARLIRA